MIDPRNSALQLIPPCFVLNEGKASARPLYPPFGSRVVIFDHRLCLLAGINPVARVDACGREDAICDGRCVYVYLWHFQVVLEVFYINLNR